MPDRRLPPRRLLLAVAVLTAPTVVVLVVLVALGLLPFGAALLAGLAVAGLLATIVRPHLAYLAAVAAHLRGRAPDRGVVPAQAPHEPGPSAVAPELREAVAAADRAWAARRRELETAIAAGEAILSSLPDPLILIDGSRRVTRANAAADVLFGEPLGGRDLFALLRNPALVEAVDAALSGAGGRVVEFSRTVPEERSFTARVERLPQPLPDGTVGLITLHDMTRIKQADRMRADFVANANHELRTPLASLTGFIETLMGPAKDDEDARERFLAIMHEQARRMTRLVEDLLCLSRIELNEHSPPSGTVRLDRVVGSVTDILQLKAAARNMRIELDAAPPDVPIDTTPIPLADLPEVTGDADELAQLFQNLLDNAIKYGRAESTIRVFGWVAPDTLSAAPRPADTAVRFAGRRPRLAVALAVADEGEGIAREHLSRLTERFYRIDSARSRDLGGTGLGLAIVKHIVNRHRGGLRIESTPGKGSMFTVFLPVAPTARERLAAAGRTAGESDS